MKKILLNVSAGIGILALVFVAYGYTSSSSLNSDYPKLENGKTYVVTGSGIGGYVTIIDNSNGNWIKIEQKGKTGILNLNNVTFISPK